MFGVYVFLYVTVQETRLKSDKLASQSLNAVMLASKGPGDSGTGGSTNLTDSLVDGLMCSCVNGIKHI
jgi:hypothetical protein